MLPVKRNAITPGRIIYNVVLLLGGSSGAGATLLPGFSSCCFFGFACTHLTGRWRGGSVFKEGKWFVGLEMPGGFWLT